MFVLYAKQTYICCMHLAHHRIARVINSSRRDKDKHMQKGVQLEPSGSRWLHRQHVPRHLPLSGRTAKFHSWEVRTWSLTPGSMLFEDSKRRQKYKKPLYRDIPKQLAFAYIKTAFWRKQKLKKQNFGWKPLIYALSLTHCMTSDMSLIPQSPHLENWDNHTSLFARGAVCFADALKI